MHNIETINIGEFVSLFNLDNNKYITVHKQEYNHPTFFDFLKKETSFYEQESSSILEDLKPTIITLVINITKRCNLQCTYCFNHDKKEINREQLQFSEIKKYILMMMENYPNVKHFHIDLTGDGEPLLRFDLIKKVIELTNEISKDDRTVKVGFCTNGTLLTEEIISYLNQNDIFFGVSIDGTKKINDLYRKGKKYKSVYKTITKNIKNIDSSYIGAAISVTGQNYNLVKNIKKLDKYFGAFSMKPIREINEEFGAITINNVEKVMVAYSDLYDFLLAETLKLNTWYIVKILKDTDLFGRYLKRILINQSTLTRCDAAIYRFALDNDRKIYPCGAMSKRSKFEIGSLENGINTKKTNDIFHHQIEREYCKGCWAQPICGGICMIYEMQLLENNLKNEKALCQLKKHVIKLAIHFKNIIYQNHPNIFQKLVNLSMDRHYI